MADDILGKMGLDVKSFETSIQTAIESMDKLNTKAASIDKSVKQAGTGVNKAAKEVGFLGTALKVAGGFFAVGKVVEYGKKLIDVSVAAFKARKELEGISSQRGGAFQSDAALQSNISAGQAALDKHVASGADSATGDITETFASRAKGMWQGIADDFVTTVTGKLQDTGAKEAEAAKRGREELTKLEIQQAGKQQEKTAISREASFGNSQAAEEADIARRLKEQQGANDKLEPGAKKSANDAAVAQSQAELDQSKKKYDLLHATQAEQKALASITSTGTDQAIKSNQQELDALDKILDGTIQLNDVERQNSEIKQKQLEQQQVFLQRQRAENSLDLDIKLASVHGSARTGEIAQAQADFQKSTKGVSEDSPEYRDKLRLRDLNVAIANQKYDAMQKETDAQKEIAGIEKTGVGRESKTLEIEIEKTKFLRDQVNIGDEQRKEYEAQLAALERQQKDLRINKELQDEYVATSTQIMQDQAEGEDEVAKIEQIRLNYQKQIVQALRDGDTVLADQLGKQSALSQLAANAAQHDLSPQERSKQHAAERKHERSMRSEARRELQAQQDAINHPESMRRDSYIHHVSAATQGVFDQYQKVFGGKAVADAQKQANTTVASMTVVSMGVGALTGPS